MIEFIDPISSSVTLLLPTPTHSCPNSYGMGRLGLDSREFVSLNRHDSLYGFSTVANPPRSSGGYFRKCDEYVRATGLKNTEIAKAAGIHEQSVRRARASTERSSDTTIQRIINALNELYYDRHPPKLSFAKEFEAEE